MMVMLHAAALLSMSSQVGYRDLTGVHRAVLHLIAPLPDGVDRGVNEQLQDEACEDAPDHRGGDALHHVRARPQRPHDGNKTHEHRRHGHHLGPDPLDSPVDDGLLEVLECLHASLPALVVIGPVSYTHLRAHETDSYL